MSIASILTKSGKIPACPNPLPACHILEEKYFQKSLDIGKIYGIMFTSNQTTSPETEK
jgi:hypothetical protein